MKKDVKSKKYSYLCRAVIELNEFIEPEFLREISELETDIHGVRLTISRLGSEDRPLKMALRTICTEIEKSLAKFWDARDLPTFKGTLSLLNAWPEDRAIILQSKAIVRRAVLLADKAKVRSGIRSLIENSCEPIREETRRYAKVGEAKLSR